LTFRRSFRSPGISSSSLEPSPKVITHHSRIPDVQAFPKWAGARINDSSAPSWPTRVFAPSFFSMSIF
jgi:hypothetical protein